MADSKSGNMSSVKGKKLINDPSHCVDDSLEGFALTNPQVKLLKGHKVVIRSDVDQLIGSNKVCLISGGGSGHEPSQAGFVGKGMLTATVSGEVFTSPPSSSILAAIRLCSSLAGVLLIVTNYTGGGSGHEPSHAGYVGNGMLSAAVCGDVFTSPPSSSILATIRTCASPGGVLLIVKNYTGDRLNFGKAAELAKDEGINVEMVIVGEDCALTSKDKSAGRRGLCGTVFIHKLAGALAEAGKPLNEIVDVVRAAAKEMGTISISLSPCSVPGQAPTFQIPDDAVEFGLGIHGEPGVTRTEGSVTQVPSRCKIFNLNRGKMASANSLVKRMVDHLLSSQYIPSLEGKEVAVIVNNLGGTSNLELSLMAGEVVKYLDAATVAPGWPKNGCLSGITDITYESGKCYTDQDPSSGKVYGSANEIGKVIFKCLTLVSDSLMQNEDKLNELDRAAGDGDCGSTFGRGARAIKEHLGSVDSTRLPVNDSHDLMLALAWIVEASMGGSSGALLSLFFTAAARSLKGTHDITAYLAGLRSGISAMKMYGGAEEGDRTMLDSLYPALQALEKEIQSGNNDPKDAFEKSAQAAESGAQETANMKARAGRASYVGSEHLKVPDPGAVAVALIFQAIRNGMSN